MVAVLLARKAVHVLIHPKLDKPARIFNILPGGREFGGHRREGPPDGWRSSRMTWCRSLQPKGPYKPGYVPETLVLNPSRTPFPGYIAN